MIEAKWLFDVTPDQVQVVVHPQSVIHSMVQFEDGAVIAQLGIPDHEIADRLRFLVSDTYEEHGAPSGF